MRKEFRVASIHATCSVVLFALAQILPAGGGLGAINYACSLLFFLMNLPSVLLIKFVYSSPENGGPYEAYLVCVCVVLVSFIAITALHSIFLRVRCAQKKKS